jgi:glycerol uptake facilitator-like aquaporin
MKKLFAEFFGTYWLVFGGCGSALFAAGIPDLGIGFAGVSLAFGLTVLTMAYAVGHISGGHFNPAVSFGLWAGGRFDAKELAPYIISQCIGGLAAAATLYFILNGQDSFLGIDNTKAGAFAKYYASEVSVKCGNEAMQIMGGYGYTKEYPAEKFLRDARLMTIGEGTSEIQKLVISREILK